MSDLVSVIIPCYNQGRFLRDAIASLQAQSHRNWEAIIVNDGSTDETDMVAKALCASESRIRYISKLNGGLSTARNVALDMAKGSWVQFLDADDLILPNKLKIQLEILISRKSTSIIYSNYFHGDNSNPYLRVEGYRLDSNFKLKRPLLDVATRWEHDFSIPIHSALFPAQPFQRGCLRFDESLPNHEDWDLWMRSLTWIDEVVYIPEELCIYRVRCDSLSRDREAMWRGFRCAISKQKVLHRQDQEIILALDYLSAMNDFIYRRGWRGIIYRTTELLSTTPALRNICHFIDSRIKPTTPASNLH